jgi:hypothetical protein
VWASATLGRCVIETGGDLRGGELLLRLGLQSDPNETWGLFDLHRTSFSHPPLVDGVRPGRPTVIAHGELRGGNISWMAAALLAVVGGYGALMRLLGDGVWLAYDDWPGRLQLFSKQEYPVIVVPTELTQEPAGRVGTAIGVFTTTDWGSELPASVRVDGRRYTHAQPARVTRIAPAGQGVAVTLDMVNKHALNGGDGEPPRLKRLRVAVSMATYTGLKEALRRITRPLPSVLAGYAGLADHQRTDEWADVTPLPELELPRTTVYRLVQAAVAEQERHQHRRWPVWSRRRPALRLDDDHNVVRRIALDHLYQLAADQVPDAPPARILATIADAYPAFADACTRRMVMQPR